MAKKKKSKGAGKVEASKFTGTSCYYSHPALDLGDGLVIYGGNCGKPVVTDADVYLGFDHSGPDNRPYPWGASDGGPIRIRYHISDGAAPNDPESFKAMVAWVADRLRAGDKVHVGCIGGHGRTGLFLAALVNHMMGDKDAAQYVRDHYCERAIESAAQVKFLTKHYGVKRVAPRSISYGGALTAKQRALSAWDDVATYTGGLDRGVTTGSPIRTQACIWGHHAR